MAKIECNRCTDVIQRVENKAGQETSKDKIKKVLTSVCENVPVLARKFCKEFVDEYTAKIVDGIIKREPADKLCKQLKFCKETV